MGFPVVIQGNYGDQRKVGTVKLHDLGTPMVLPDGSLFRYARAGGTAAVAGKLYQGVAQADTANNGSLALASSPVAGATTLTVTAGGTAITTDLYTDGYIWSASSVGTGTGRAYRVKGNASAAASSSCVITLDENESLEAAMEAATTTVGIKRNRYDAILLTSADTARVNALAGIAAASCAASSYLWVQRTGIGPAFIGGTAVVVGEHCVASSAIAGAIANAAADSAAITRWSHVDKLGRVVAVGIANGYALVDLMLE